MTERKSKKRRMRLPNGYGSVYKLSGNRRRPWIARKTTGWDKETGKQLYYTIGYFETRTKAMEALIEYNKKPIGELRDLTLNQIRENWMDTSQYEKLSDSTKYNYDAAWIYLSELGDMKIRDIKTSHFQKIIDDMHRKGLSYSSCHKVKVLAGILMKYAMVDDIVEKNYAQLVELPSNDSEKRKSFNDFEIKIIEKNADDVEWVDTILIFIYTGMRISELLTLPKANVDIKQMLIVGGIKTDAGKDRPIPIYSKIQKYILKWYNTDGEYLITRNGKPIRPDYYRKYIYYPTLEKLGIRKLSPHHARHTFGTLLARANVDPLYIQNLIGHSDYATTANIYTHLDVEDLRRAIEMIK